MMDNDQRENRRIIQREHPRQMFAAIAMFCLLASCNAFSPTLQKRSQLYLISSKRSTVAAAREQTGPVKRVPSFLQANSQQPTADFEYQELQIQMDAMREQNVKPSQLDPSKRNELKGYVEEILARRLRNKKTVDSTVPLDVRLRSSLPGTKWRMAFTTQSLMAEALPKDATITLTFAGGSGSASTGSNQVDYGLDFFKTLALKRLVAKSTYSVLKPQPNNPDTAIVQIKYDKIVTDVMGFSNVGIGLFGILKGRSTYIQTAFFDGMIWIESGVDESNFGETYYNVYAKEKDEEEGSDDDWQK
mmetsp:Transcript_25816/g.60531  ORF Transcript_25816/g.60531 Transcript_25816/m.60531 type:complete len:303 (+) Transcript_25816:265-1173(+)